MFEYQTKETRPWYQQTGHSAEWLNNKKREAIEGLRGMHGGTPLMAINNAERIVNEILNDGFMDLQVSTIRMHIEEVRRNLRRPLMMGEDAFSKLIIAGGE